MRRVRVVVHPTQRSHELVNVYVVVFKNVVVPVLTFLGYEWQIHFSNDTKGLEVFTLLNVMKRHLIATLESVHGPSFSILKLVWVKLESSIP